MPAPESRAQSRSPKALRPDAQPDTLAALRLGQQARARRRTDQPGRAPAAVTPAKATRRRTVPAPRKTLQSDLQFARRADMWAPQPKEEVRRFAGPDGRPIAEIATTITYLSEAEEGTILFQMPAPEDEGQIARLGVWEQFTLYAVCDRFVRSGAPDDDTARYPSMRALAKSILGREPRGKDNDRIERALRLLMMVTVLEGSASFVAEVDAKGKRHVIRTENQDMYHLLERVHIERKGRRIEAGEHRKLPVRTVEIRLAADIAGRLRQGLVATLSADAVRAIGLQDEGTLRLYAFLCSQRFRAGRVSAVVVDQIVRPKHSWGLTERPARFRQTVGRMAERIERADKRFSLVFQRAEDRAGGWNLTWVRGSQDGRQRRRKRTK